ncbi:MAG: protein phosphatase 2C domain-containing protein [Bacteroidia bacterium]|nr:protein phosphatase 2C domain-containing protein [Bacteroidia bacterium]
MSIRIKKPEALYEVGGRELNEDFIFPLQGEASAEERIFIVADGEGGPQAGDVGSKLLALTMAKYFQHPGPKGEVTQEFLDQALRISEGALSAHKDGHPEAKHMAMSMAMLHLGDTKATMAWIGTSRVYYYDSQNAVLVNPDSMIEGAKPENQYLISGAENPQKLNSHSIAKDDLNHGDFFLLVTDGVRDQLNERNLETLFKSSAVSAQQYNPLRVGTEINNLIQNFTKDNYSAYIIQVEKGESEEKKAVVAATPGQKVAPKREEKEEKKTDEHGAPLDSTRQSDIIRALTVAALAIFVIALLGWGGYRYFSNPYPRYMSQGNKAMEQKDYEKAREYFTKALKTKDPAKRQEARNNLEKLDIALMNTPDSRIESANGFIEEGNFTTGIDLYKKVLDVLDQQGNKLQADQVRILLGEAYLKQANEIYSKAEAADKCKEAHPIYEKGLTLLNLAGNNSVETDLIAEANKRAIACGKELGVKPTTPDGINARKVATNTNTKGNDDDKVAKMVPNARVTQPGSNVELKKWLASGQRLFVKARSSGSEYQYREAAQNLLNAGAEIDGSGAYMLSFMYHSGLGVQKDEAKALQYAQKSANKGWPSGQYYYGHLLLLREYPRDTVTAVQSLRKSADQNFKLAMQRLQELGVRY